MTTFSVSIVVLIFIGDKGDLFVFVLADQNVRLWVSLFLWMPVAVRPFLLSSRCSARCRWASSLGEEHWLPCCRGWMLHFHLLLMSSICHLAFNWLWEVEAHTQPCFRRMTWTCQTADKAKKPKQVWVRGEHPSLPLQICFYLSAENSPYPSLSTVMNYLAWRCCLLHWGSVWNVQGFLPVTEKGVREASACMGRGGRCLPCQVEKHVQLLMWLLVND